MQTLLLMLLIAAAVPVEHVTEKPVRTEGLGTCDYMASPKERPFLELLHPDEQRTGGFGQSYALTGHDGMSVGWFGVVRRVTEEKGQTRLLVEHKGFDGLTDCHILALDFNGGGDFEVVIPGKGHHIETLTLVKAYGTVAKKSYALPVVNAAFIRNWHQGAFTFLTAASEQRGSEKWRALNTVSLDDIYEPYPDLAYYVARLGKR